MEADKSKVQQSANLLAARGQFDKAIAEWKKLLADSPADGTIHNNIGDLQLKRNAISEAVEAYFQAGTAFQGSGSPLKAIAVYKKIIKIDPSRYKVYQNLGDLNAERGLVNNAVSDYLTLSKLYLKEGLVREALTVYRKIVNLDPPNLDVKRRLADLCLQEGLREEAVKTLLQLGKQCSAQNRAGEAREAYQKVLKIDPGNTSAVRLLANPQEALVEDRPSRSGDSSPASGELDREQSLDKASRQMNEGQVGEAEALLSDLLSLHPGDPEVCRLLAMLHIKRGDLAVALSEIRFLAEAAIRAEDYALAESMILEYLRADPKSVTLLELLGNMYEQNGNQDAAMTQYGKAIDLLLEEPDPEMPTRSAELYQRIVQLAPSSPLATRLAMTFAPSRRAVSQPAGEAPSPGAPGSEPSPSTETPSSRETVQVGQGGPSQASPAEQPPQPSEQEYKTHYELGMAYKDMGLLDEAVEEFRTAVHSHDCFLDASSMLAACLKDKGHIAAAIECLEQAVADSRCGENKSVAPRYELGVMYEANGLFDKAAGVFATIPNFLDVPIRLERVRGSVGKKPSSESETGFEADPAAPRTAEKATVGAASTAAPERKKRRISYL